MNFSLKVPSKKKEGLKFGLNKTSAKDAPPSREQNAFGDDEDDDEGSQDGKSSINRDLNQQQESLRNRIAAAGDEYDFDGSYETVHQAREDEKTKSGQGDERKSRYIGELLKASKRRNHDREMALERKIAREQAEEDAEFEGKEKFMTSAYKRKLAERELFAVEDAKEEERQAKKPKKGMMEFYGNMSKNVSMGGQERIESSTEDKPPHRPSFLDGFEASTDAPTGERPSFLDGFEAPSDQPASPHDGTGATLLANDTECLGKGPDTSSLPPEKSLRKIREEKVAAARVRYFKRHNLPLTEQ